jgi:hypothetical protein
VNEYLSDLAPQDAAVAIRSIPRRFARTIDSVDPGDWLRRAVLNGTQVTALDIVRRVVDQAVQHLRAAERAPARAKEGVG